MSERSYGVNSPQAATPKKAILVFGVIQLLFIQKRTDQKITKLKNEKR